LSPPGAEPPLSAYDYDLPPELIAQEPPPARGDSRLLVLHRGSGLREHRLFPEITTYFRPGDILVLNETRVFPARLRARRRTGASVEVLLVEKASGGAVWLALGRPGRAFRRGEDTPLVSGEASIRALGREGDFFLVEIWSGGRALSADEVIDLCERTGEMPLPPYIRRSGEDRKSPLDRERYQTVFARRTGAVAAPTAGLHVTAELLAAAAAAGVEVARLSLHVGPGTFRPLDEEAYRGGVLHGEQVEIGREAGEAVLRARASGRRVIAVGTTTVRALESFALDPVLPFIRRTDLFIKPGHAFRAVDALVTNFHLPRSSLLLLVSAFAGREAILDAYREAARERYRFYSYGDAMFIV
jgi:S-adenosylmethionine:tRNA ribosyltransferase-isomerase